MSACVWFGRSSRGGRAVVAALTFTLTLGLAASASAASLTITQSGDPNAGNIAFTAAGSADTSSYLFLYEQTSTACGATPAAEQSAHAAPFSNSGAAISAGSFSVPASTTETAPAQYTTCAYLEAQTTDPNQPGPLYNVPAAAASSSVIEFPCGAEGFSITHVAVSTVQSGGLFGGTAKMTAQTASSGDLETTLNGTASGGASSTGTGPVVFSLADPVGGPHRPPDRATFLVNFYRSTKAGQSCAQPDGTVAMTGATGTHDPTQTLVITYLAPPFGGMATVNGVTVPGSDSAPSVSSVLLSGSIGFGTVTYHRAGVLTGKLVLGRRTLGQFAKVISKGKPTALSFRLTKSGKTILRKAGGKPTLVAKLTFKPKSGQASSSTKSITLS